jgi:hypothetical protein
MIQGSSYNGSYVVAILPDHRIQILLVDRPENDAEGDKKKEG